MREGVVLLTPPVRACLLALVLLNLLFVHVTRAVELRWLAPLYVLTALSPWLSRCQGSLIYRLLWNGGVLAVFAVLVRHATSLGPRFLLEDGLILAVFCQVHLLNNLGPRQKPDLLFFNSFLIALVTSFFCQDLVFALVFAAYALLLTVGLQLSCAAAHGPAPGLALHGIGRAGLALAWTLLAFVLVPRDFQREGLVGETLRNAGLAAVGFDERVELGRTAQAVASNRVVLQARLLDGQARDVPYHWRGATFVHFEQGRWHVDPQLQRDARPGLDEPWLRPSMARWVKADGDDRARLSVTVVDLDLDRLCAPLEAHQVDVETQGEVLVMPRADGTLPYLGFEHRGLAYELRLRRSERAHAATPGAPATRALAPFVKLRDGDLPETGRALAARIAAAHRGAPQHQLVAAVQQELATSFRYLLPGSQGAARDLAGFLAGDAGGHCEYFATALALMLRSQQVPCRLVTGFAAAEWDAAGQTLTIRSKHAHAWVEVRDPAGFWYAVDATPAGAVEAATGAGSTLASLAALLRQAWDGLTAFDGKARAEAVARLRASARELVLAIHDRPAPALGVAGLLVLALLARRWRAMRRGPRVVRRYRRAVAACGLRPRCDETPRELLRRAREQRLDPVLVERLQRATEVHERGRYAGAPAG